MKKQVILLFIIIALISSMSLVLGIECGTVPTDGCTISSSTTFTTGTYHFVNTLNITVDSIIIDCNGATFVGDNTSSLFNISNRDGITIKNCNIKSYLNPIAGNTISGIHLESNDVSQFLGYILNPLVSSDDITFESNYIHDAEDPTYSTYPAAIWAEGSINDIKFYNNNITNTMLGIILMDISATNIDVENNNFEVQWDGLYMDDLASNVNFTNNYFHTIQSGGAFVGDDGNNFQIENNRIVNGQIALNANNSIVTNNNISNSSYGIYIEGDSITVTNNILRNVSNAFIIYDISNYDITNNEIYDTDTYVFKYYREGNIDISGNYISPQLTYCHEFDEIIQDGKDNPEDGIITYSPVLDAPNGNPIAACIEAPMADKQDGVCEGARKTFDGTNWNEPDYSTYSPYYQATETGCDTLDNDCDGQTDVGCSCIEPVIGFEISDDITFCPGTYNLIDQFLVTANNSIIDCNGAHFIGDNTSRLFRFSDTSGNTIKNCDIESYYYGIEVSYSTDLTIIDNSFINNKWYGHSFSRVNNSLIKNNDYYGSALSLSYYNHNNIIEENNFYRTKYAAYGSSSSNSGTIVRNNFMNTTSYAVYLGGANNVVQNNNIEECNGCMYLWYSENTLIENNVMFNNDSLKSNIIFYYNASDIIVRNNSMTGGNDGVRNYNGNFTNIVIDNNSIIGARYSSYAFAEIENMTFTNNYAEDGGWMYGNGLEIENANNVLIQGNTLINNSDEIDPYTSLGTHMHGMRIRDADNIIVRNNTISEQTTGIYTHKLTNFTFEENVITDCSNGIYLYDLENANILYNEFDSNNVGINLVNIDGYLDNSNIKHNTITNSINYSIYGGYLDNFQFPYNYFGTTDCTAIDTKIDSNFNIGPILDASGNVIEEILNDGTDQDCDPTNDNYSLNLKAGWNLLSTPFVTVVTDPCVDFQSLADYSYIGQLNNAGDGWDYCIGGLTGSLQKMDASEYDFHDATWMYTDTNQTISAPWTVDTLAEVSLNKGWNFVGFAALTSVDIQYAITEDGSVTQIERFNPNSQSWETWKASIPSDLNEFTTLDLGYGYWVYATKATTLRFI